MKQKVQKSEKAQNKQAVEIIYTTADIDRVVCDGGVGPLGHPQVWYSFDGRDHVCCHYCGRKFIKNTADT